MTEGTLSNNVLSLSRPAGAINIDVSSLETKANANATYQPKGNYLTSVPIGGTNIGGVKNGGNVTIETDGSMNCKTSGERLYKIESDTSSFMLSLSSGSTIESFVGYSFTYKDYSFINFGIFYALTTIDSKMRVVTDTEPQSKTGTWKVANSDAWVTTNCKLSYFDDNMNEVNLSDTGKYYKIHNAAIRDLISEDESGYCDIILHNSQIKVNKNLGSTSSGGAFYISPGTYIEEFDTDPGF